MTDFELAASSYGKDDVRILRLVRDDSDPSSHRLVEYKIRCLLSGPSFTRSYTHADNSMVVATDSIKNILNVMALQSKPEEVLVPEVFALVVMNKFLSDYQHVEGVELDIDMLKWSRISLGTPLAGSSGSSSTVAALPNSQQHPHSFIRDGNEKRFVKAIGKRGPKGEAMVDTLESGLRDLVVLKSTGSAFYDFVTDKYTTLPSVQDRLFSTSVNCQYRIKLAPSPISALLGDDSSLPPFDAIAGIAFSHVLNTFATHVSPSVQATMYQTGGAILNDAVASSVERVDLMMPNRHYIPVNFAFVGEHEVKDDQHQVFLPSEHPSGLIKASVTRKS